MTCLLFWCVEQSGEETGFSIIATSAVEGIYISVTSSPRNPAVNDSGLQHEFPTFFKREVWTHVSVTHDFLLKTTSLYLNGVLKGSTR